MPESDPGRRRRHLLVLAFVVLVINFPMLHSWWLDGRLAASGVESNATVLNTDASGSDDDPDRWVSFRFTEEVDPGQEPWIALVDERTWTGLEVGDDLPVRVVPGTPQAFEVEGQRHSRSGVVTTLAADAVLALGAYLFWRTRLRGHRDRVTMDP